MFQVLRMNAFLLKTVSGRCRRQFSCSLVARHNEEWEYWHQKNVLVGAGEKKRRVSHSEHHVQQFDLEQFGELLPEKKLAPQHSHNRDNQLSFGPVVVSKSMEKRNKSKHLVAKQNLADHDTESLSSEFHWMSNIKTESIKERNAPATIKIEGNLKVNEEHAKPKPLLFTKLEETTVSIKPKDNPVQNPQRNSPRLELPGDVLQIPLDRTNGLPSVTQILKATMSEKSKMVLARWEEKMIEKLGEDGFAAMKAKTFERGHVLHKHVEDYMTTGHLAENQEIKDEVSQNHFTSITSVLKDFSDPFALESAVVHPVLGYHGILDCVAKYKDTTVLIDWKTSERIKPSLASLFDNPLQVAAYIGAVNYDDNYEPVGSICGGAVCVVYNTGYPAQVHTLGEKDLQKAWRAWLKRLSLYKQMVARGEIKKKEVKT